MTERREILVDYEEWLEMNKRLGFAEGLLNGWTYSADGDHDRCLAATKEFLDSQPIALRLRSDHPYCSGEVGGSSIVPTKQEVAFFQALFDRYSEGGGVVDLALESGQIIKVLRRHYPSQPDDAEIARLREGLDTIKNPDQQLCCTGYNCGCQGATVGEYAAWLMNRDNPAVPLLENILDTSGARKEYNAMKHADAVKAAEAFLAKHKEPNDDQ